jgi:hypothetical protein
VLKAEADLLAYGVPVEPIAVDASTEMAAQLETRPITDLAA